VDKGEYLIVAGDVTLAFGHHEDRTPTHGYEPTREAKMKNPAAPAVKREGEEDWGTERWRR
jgi:hypothetical protein